MGIFLAVTLLHGPIYVLGFVQAFMPAKVDILTKLRSGRSRNFLGSIEFQGSGKPIAYHELSGNSCIFK
jgi:hypothetical protein